MANVFLSYASEDRACAQRLAQWLERQGWSVWWDPRILPGRNFYAVIEAELSRALCVVVLWSQHSILSDWVKNEATEAARRGVLVPALIEDVLPPLAFRHIEAANLISWDGKDDWSELRNLKESLLALAPMEETKPTPPIELPRHDSTADSSNAAVTAPDIGPRSVAKRTAGLLAWVAPLGVLFAGLFMGWLPIVAADESFEHPPLLYAFGASIWLASLGVAAYVWRRLRAPS